MKDLKEKKEPEDHSKEVDQKIAGMDMISFGPQIECPHSPDERVHVPSVGRFYKLVAATLTELA